MKVLQRLYRNPLTNELSTATYNVATDDTETDLYENWQLLHTQEIEVVLP